MSFTNPSVLFLLLVPAALFAFVWRRRNRRVALPFDHGLPGRGTRLGFLIDVAETLPSLLLAVATLILAGPQKLSAPKSRRVFTNIEFCVDISGSMTAKFGSGSRYDASMSAIDDFLDYRKGDAFGLTFFGSTVLHWVPLTSDASAIRCAPPFMRPEVAPPWFNGTRIGKALLSCRDVLIQREEGDRMIILVSDGSSADLYNGADMEVAKKLRADHIVVYAVHISSGSVPDPIVNITSVTGGEVFQPGDPGALQRVFARIDTMQATRLEKVSAEILDNFGPLCLVGLGLLGVHLLALLGLRYTPW